MPEKNLPESCKGYLTQNLLLMMEQIQTPQGIPPETPKPKIAAMCDLDHEYRLSGAAKAADRIRQEQAKRQTERTENKTAAT
jgi:hypothetical protein